MLRWCQWGGEKTKPGRPCLPSWSLHSAGEREREQQDMPSTSKRNRPAAGLRPRAGLGVEQRPGAVGLGEHREPLPGSLPWLLLASCSRWCVSLSKEALFVCVALGRSCCPSLVVGLDPVCCRATLLQGIFGWSLTSTAGPLLAGCQPCRGGPAGSRRP